MLEAMAVNLKPFTLPSMSLLNMPVAMSTRFWSSNCTAGTLVAGPTYSGLTPASFQ